ncbi:MAG: hypothetical protein DRN37_01680 [Thermoplasmata archaeon]|nr:MAG: hypothetical protein DRN37_01680 [Thermoplasmata archaeon]
MEKEWKALYEAARDFRDHRPWSWMSDADLFGVQNPYNGEIGYCCVLGELGEVFALAVYSGSEGLEGYLRMQSGEFDVDDPDVMHIQKCLVASFEDRDRLEEHDYNVIKKLGLKFRGRNAWPQFRSFLPGYVPWHLTKDEVKFLTIALRQAVNVSLRFKRDQDLLSPPDEDLLLIRFPDEKGKSDWIDVWMEIPEPEKSESPAGQVDELRLKRIGKNLTNRKGIWEIESFYFPGAVEEGERPFFPRTFVVADHASGLILDFWIDPPWESFANLQANLLNFFEKSEILPEGIFVSKYDIFELLKPIASGLNIDIETVGELNAVEEFKSEMYSSSFDIPGD